MAAGANPGISRSLLRRELSELETYMERALFFFHVAPALVQTGDEGRYRLESPRLPDRLLPAVDRRVQPVAQERPPLRLRRSWLPALF